MAEKLKEGEKVIAVKFGELWLRGRNRSTYIHILINNVSRRLRGEKVQIKPEYDRIVIRLNRGADVDKVTKKLGTVFGVSKFEVSEVTAPTLSAIKKACAGIISKMDKKKDIVRFNSHRAYKLHKFNSLDVIRELIKISMKKGVECSNKGYNKEINISITKDTAFINTGSIKGAGGLPTESRNKAVVLLSGGIDSPVAAYYAMKRGVTPVYVHFHGYPNNKAKELSKINRLVKALQEYCPEYTLYLIPTSHFQLAAIDSGSSETILLKAFMLSIADKIAEKEKATLIYTGDALGQVASQTPQNIAAESAGIIAPIMRPLIGLDKEEITKIARSIGTYELSLLPYKDVCSINAKNPRTSTPVWVIEDMYKKFKLKKVELKSLKAATSTRTS